MIEFASENLADLRPDIDLLAAEHWDEIAHLDLPLAIDWSLYEGSDFVRCYTVRDHRRLIGYGVFCLMASTHHGVLAAHQDAFYVRPEYRVGRVVKRFLTFIEDEARGEGAQVIYHHAGEAFERLLVDAGYKPLQTLYGRRLDKE